MVGNTFYIDLSDVTLAYGLTKREYRFVMQSAVESGILEVRRQIIQQATYGDDRLSQTRQKYTRGLTQPQIGPLKGSITLVGTLANMIEQGASAFDMKDGFRRSQKAKEGKKGWYLTIPFRWGTPTALAENEAFSSKMDTPLYDIAKDRGGARITTEEIKDSQSTFGVINRRETITENYGTLSMNKRSAYEHKFPTGAGVQKDLSPYQVAVQGSYVSFRRVSQASAENSWIFPGLEARNFMPKALYEDSVDDAIDMGIEQALSQLGK